MFFIKPYKIADTTENEQKDPQEVQEIQNSCKIFDDTRVENKIRILMRIILAFWFTFYVLSETMFLKFAITYYQYCPHQLTAEEAARLFSYSTISYSVFRFLNVFASMKLTINTIIKIHYVVLVVGMILMIVAHFNYIALWVSGPIIMWGFAPMFAGTYTFAAR